ncbi:MAG: type II secretion system protein [Planctomycetota bacterium]
MVRQHARQQSNGRFSGFTLVELLVTIAIIAVLLSILLPSLRQAREQGRLAICGSNIRQIAIANIAYSCDHQGRFCPGAAGMRTSNLHRWHGTRTQDGYPFDPQNGPLVPYLGVDQRIRACPAFREMVTNMAAFELGNGGYGYNQAYVGRVLIQKSNGDFSVVTDLQGVFSERVRQPGRTVMFSDAAFAATANGVIEYSFSEPRFHPEYLHYDARLDPSIHFRHQGQASIAWCDGHVGRRSRTFTWSSGFYEGDPVQENIGWFGETDDNGFFDLE